MAEQLDSFPTELLGRRGRPRGSKYDQFLDGKVWRLVRGTDFPEDGDADKIVRSIRMHANRQRNLGIKAGVMFYSEIGPGYVNPADAPEKDRASADVIVVQATEKRNGTEPLF
jgi:hypothetical protein